MSIDSIMSNINRAHKDIADLQKKISDEKKKESQALTKMNQIQRSITKNTSLSTLNSKMRETERLNKDIANSSSKQAELQKKLAHKTSDLNKYQLQLSKEQEMERKKQDDLFKKQKKEQMEYKKKITRELSEQKRLIEEAKNRPESPTIGLNSDIPEPQFDFFISHASEDKDEFVRPLAEELIQCGARVWYDEFALKIGDSLRRSIDKGLANSRYGIVVISSSFISKNWPQYEVDGMVAKEMEGVKVILPIWHKVSKTEVLKYSPTLADKVALNSSIYDISEIAQELLKVL